MKALIYKEFKLAMHPICYIFIFLFPFMILIPSYPLGVAFIYVLACYPVLFLGANKGQQSNDLLFSTLLPVRKKDVVFARIITVFFMQFATILMMSILYPLAFYVQEILIASGEELVNAGIGLDGFISLIAIALIAFSISDLTFFPIYYKKGKSIVLSTISTIIVFTIFIFIFSVILFYIPGMEWYINIVSGEIWIQVILLIASLIIYVLLHYLVYRISSKRLEKVDF